MEREEVLLKIAQLISNNDSDVIIEVEFVKEITTNHNRSRRMH